MYGRNWPNTYTIAEIVEGFRQIDLRIEAGRDIGRAFDGAFQTRMVEEVDDELWKWIPYTDALLGGPSPYAGIRASWEALSDARRSEVKASRYYHTTLWPLLDIVD